MFQRAGRLVLATALSIGLVGAVAQGAAYGDVVLWGSTTVSMPDSVSVGDTSVPGHIELANLSPGAHVDQTVCDFGDPNYCTGDQGITLIPSCSSISGNWCAPEGADPGVFQISSTATGAEGTACAGITFEVTQIEPTFGSVRFTPVNATSVKIPAQAKCRINFTFDVLKVPADADPQREGAQTKTLTRHKQYHSAKSVTFSGVSAGTTVQPGEPTISTTASPGTTLGKGDLSDTAVVGGRVNPVAGATVTFRLYGPDDPTCSGDAVYTSTVSYPVAGGPVTSGSFTPTQAGVYRWVASYSGDANNSPATGMCGDPDETVEVLAPIKAVPAITTQASAGGVLGTPVRDVATLTGGNSPTGDYLFLLFSDPACTTEVFRSTVSGAGATAISGWFIPSTPGTYYWTASYSGDDHNEPAAAACNEPNESVTITPFAPPPLTRTITGDFSGPLTVGKAESVRIVDARISGPVTVEPGGALTVENSRLNRGLVADGPSFLSICGSRLTAAAPSPALSVSGGWVPVRVGDPAAGCAGNYFAGPVAFDSVLALTFKANTVSGSVTAGNGGPGATVIGANTITSTLACSANNPAPTNGGQPNSAATRTGQCAGL